MLPFLATLQSVGLASSMILAHPIVCSAQPAPMVVEAVRVWPTARNVQATPHQLKGPTMQHTAVSVTRACDAITTLSRHVNIAAVSEKGTTSTEVGAPYSGTTPCKGRGLECRTPSVHMS